MLVGTASDVVLNPRSCSGGTIHTYKLVTMPDDGGQKLELLHTVRIMGIDLLSVPVCNHVFKIRKTWMSLNVLEFEINKVLESP